SSSTLERLLKPIAPPSQPSRAPLSSSVIASGTGAWLRARASRVILTHSRFVLTTDTADTSQESAALIVDPEVVTLELETLAPLRASVQLQGVAVSHVGE